MKRLISCVAVLVLSSIARAEIPQHPYPSVVYTFEKRETPEPQKIFVARIDLTDPNVNVRVSRGGPDPDGDGKWETTLMRPTKVADREGFDVVINGDFSLICRARTPKARPRSRSLKAVSLRQSSARR